MDRQLQKLKRNELLQILLEVEQENEQLVQENKELKERLASKELVVREAGSLANASVQLSGVLLAAQDAAEMYLQGVRTLCLEFARETEELCKKELGQSARGSLLQEEVLELFVQAGVEESESSDEAKANKPADA